MERFNKTIYGYDPEEVKAYLDEIINLVARMVDSNKEKNQEIIRLQQELEETKAKYNELKALIIVDLPTPLGPLITVILFLDLVKSTSTIPFGCSQVGILDTVITLPSTRF